jgi:7,8-dihydropterin-6-yl-methyl-4-(beta-D-ribofuranosyl)aminobenzene 5'-phosphate synthase
MKVTVLVENQTIDPHLESEHGLSLYIETEKHRILFDAGDSDVFEKNAIKLGIDLSSVDTFILSHGHHDHGGGLNRFIEINKTAKIYAHQKAFDPHFSKRENRYVNIGVPFPQEAMQRLIFNQDQLIIDEELTLFSKITETRFYPSSNKNLYMDEDNRCALDDFKHEQNLIIKENNKHILIAGCAHHGMLNIIHEANHLFNTNIDVAIGGLHMFSRSTGISESNETIEHIAHALLKTGVLLLTCHCTGELAYHILSPIMKDRITYIKTGSIQTID